MTKKILLAALCVLIVLAFTACGGETTYTMSISGAAPENAENNTFLEGSINVTIAAEKALGTSMFLISIYKMDGTAENLIDTIKNPANPKLKDDDTAIELEEGIYKIVYAKMNKTVIAEETITIIPVM
jgi:hypothetical protein